MQEEKSTEQERAASEKSRLIQEMSDDMLSGPFGHNMPALCPNDQGTLPIE